jgi:hypothetical protein
LFLLPLMVFLQNKLKLIASEVSGGYILSSPGKRRVGVGQASSRLGAAMIK